MKTKTNHKRATIGNQVVKLFHGRKLLTTRDVYKGINRGKRSKQRASIAGVRRAVRILVKHKQLKVRKTDHRMWVLQKR